MSNSDQKNQVSKPKSFQLPLLPLKDIVVFPHMIVPVFINENLCINAVEQALGTDRKIFLSAFRNPNEDTQNPEGKLNAPFDIHDRGTICNIMRTRKLPDGRMKVLIQGVQKAEVVSLVSTDSFPLIEVVNLEEPTLLSAPTEVDALVRATRDNLEKVVSLGKVLSPDILMVLEDVSDPGKLSDLVSANLGLKVEEAQNILNIIDPVERIKTVHQYLIREIEVFQMQLKIQSQAKEEIAKMQREHFLREQMRVIKDELGDGDSKEEIEALWKKSETLDLSEEAKTEVTRQLKRLDRIHPDTSEAALTRAHVETLLSLPWGYQTEDNLDLKNVQEVLDNDHYGLKQAKDRIIEYLAVKKLNPAAKSPIICFTGPPGVGKTSLGKSIAESMGRKFVRISLGGVRDEADIRGHRRTYVGAFPGRVIQSIKKAGSQNPVIMLDEIDKLGSDSRGDPSSALLEVLDPEQNSTFADHYLGVPFDISNVMFIANCNQLDTIPAPLRDRLEIIEVSGYTAEEKSVIANRYLIPKQVSDTGLNNKGVDFSRSAVDTLISDYTRESGLRGLNKQIASVCRKIARKYAESELQKSSKKKASLKISSTTIQKHLGVAKFSNTFYHLEPMAGVSLGLAYTTYGGEVMAIETNLLPVAKGAGRLVLTGQLGDVMQESAKAALSYIRSKASLLGVDLEKLNNSELHVHCPAGAVPKDGPSAGVAMATSLISALRDIPPTARVAMTGEITLHGKVLAIGGLKEKLLAAQREGITTVVIPESNRASYDELPANLKKKLSVKFAKHYLDAFKVLFSSQANSKNIDLNSVETIQEKEIAS